MNGICLLLSLFLFFENGKWGMINEKGVIVQEAKYDFIDDPNSCGYSIVKDGSKFGLFDPSGQFALPVSFDSLGFGSDSVLIGKKGAEYQLYRLDGTVVLYSMFHRISPQDFLKLYTADGKKGLLGFGKWLLPVYDTIVQLDKFVLTVQSGKFSLFTDSLDPISQRPFDSIAIGPNFLRTKDHKNYGFLDRNGKEILPCVYSYAKEVDAHHFILKESANSKAKLWNVSSKKVVVSGDFENITIPSAYETKRYKPLPDRYFYTVKGELEGVIQRTGHVVLPPKYDQVYYAGWQRFGAQDSSGNHLYDLSGKRISKHPLGAGVLFDSIPVSIFNYRSLKGAVNIDGEILLPPQQPYVFVEKDRIVYWNTRNGKKNTIKFDQRGKFVERIKNFGTIRIIDTTLFTGVTETGQRRIKIDRKVGHRFGVGYIGHMEIRDRNGERYRYSKGVLFDSLAHRFVGSTFLDVGISTINKYHVAPAVTLIGQMALITRSGRFIRTISYKNDRGKMQATGFDRVGEFCEGLAAIDVGNPDFRIMEQEYLGMDLLKENSFSYRKMSGRWGFIDTKGKLVIPPRFSTISDFQQGVCIVGIFGKGEQVINPSGNYVLPKFYTKVERDQTNDTLFLVHEPGSAKGLMNNQYRITIKPRYSDVKGVSEGVFPAKGKTNKWAFYHANGSALTDSIFSNTRLFAQGYAAVAQKGLWGLIDSLGHTVVTPMYKNISDVYRHRYFADIKDHIKILDTKGKTIASKNAEFLKYIGVGKLLVARGDKKGILNTEGKWLVDPVYESITDWSSNGYAVGYIGRKKFLISPDGTTLECADNCQIPSNEGKPRQDPENTLTDFIKTAQRSFPNIWIPSEWNLKTNGFQPGGLIPFSVKSHLGIIDKNGTVILEPIYSYIKPLRNGMYKVYHENQIGYYKLYEGWVFKPW